MYLKFYLCPTLLTAVREYEVHYLHIITNRHFTNSTTARDFNIFAK